MESKLISVIVPVYNVQNYLEKCIVSILNQTYPNFELILIDDGSTDDSGEICEEFKRRDQRVYVKHIKNGGQANARNLGIDYARGEYISFIDADDFICETYYEQLVGAIIKSDSDMAIGSMEIIYDNFNANIKASIEKDRELEILNAKQALYKLCLGQNIGVSPCTKLFSKKLFAEIRFPKGFVYEDLLTIPYMFEKCKRIAYVEAAHYYYYQRKDSTTHRVISEKDFVILDASDKLINYVDEFYPELHDSAIRRYIAETFQQLVQKKLVKSDNYMEFIKGVKARCKTRWKEGLNNEYLTFKQKVGILIMLVHPRLYKLVYLKWGINNQ